MSEMTDWIYEEDTGDFCSPEEHARRNRSLGELTAAEWKRKKDKDQGNQDRIKREVTEHRRWFWHGGFLWYVFGYLAAASLILGLIHCTRPA